MLSERELGKVAEGVLDTLKRTKQSKYDAIVVGLNDVKRAVLRDAEDAGFCVRYTNHVNGYATAAGVSWPEES